MSIDIKGTLKSVSKALAGFVVGVLSVIIGRFMSGETPVPSIYPFDTEAWLGILIAGIASYLGVYIAPRNIPTPEQAEAQIPADVEALPIDARQRVTERLGKHEKPNGTA